MAEVAIGLFCVFAVLVAAFAVFAALIAAGERGDGEG